jgi:uncharacterized protein (TIGR02996 family)
LTTPVPALPDSYLRAVLALPDDDGPRLCAADWWDERGAAERAEFVRVQCELARWSCECDTSEERVYHDECRCKERAELRRRERELAVHCAAWAGTDEMMKALGADRVRRLGLSMAFTDLEFSLDGRPFALGEFRRGFVEEVTAAAADFLAHADALRAACPLRRVRLTTRPRLSFGEVVYQNRSGETLGSGGYVRSATWDVLVEGELRPRRFGLQVAISGRECRTDGGAYSLSVFEARISGARTVGGYFKARWPGIDFEMPTVGFRPGILSPSQLPLTTDGVPALADPRTLTRGALP